MAFSKSVFIILFILSVCVDMWTCTYHSICVEVREQLVFSPSTMWVVGFELRSSFLTASPESFCLPLYGFFETEPPLVRKIDLRLTIELRPTLNSQQSSWLSVPSANATGINIFFKNLHCVPNFLFPCPVDLLMKLVPNDNIWSPSFYNEEALPISSISSSPAVLWRKPSLDVG